MQQLPLKLRYLNNEIACRFLRKPSSYEPLVMAIPGGPGLSGQYLDHFLIQLSEYMNINVGIFDLPNHGESVLTLTKLPLSYQDCHDLVIQTLKEIANLSDKIIIFGQSFGARLAFDALTSLKEQLAGAFLTGFPYEFQMSKKMQDKINLFPMDSKDDLGLEEYFAKSWINMLPHCTYHPLPSDIFNALISDLKLSGNEHILDDVPSIEVSAAILSQQLALPKIGILQGCSDGVVPDDNILKLKSIVPYAQYYEIEKCGHFPMVEKSEETLRAFSQFHSFCRDNSSGTP
jgi:pimeloyl-ACP methyl ester carboxylesterase